MNYWLMKSEPESYSIDDLKKEKKAHWDGVRNYQARNIMRDQMKIGDQVLFYHSNVKPPGIVGLCKVCGPAIPDDSAWDPKSGYHDPKASPENPIWVMAEIAFLKKFPRMIPLPELKTYPELKQMPLLQKGQRLSVQPVSKAQFEFIIQLS